MSELWIQCFTCCVTERPQGRRRRIDRSMIGQPTNFRHTGHIGSDDMADQIRTLQSQLSSKGGYGFDAKYSIPVVDVKN